MVLGLVFLFFERRKGEGGRGGGGQRGGERRELILLGKDEGGDKRGGGGGGGGSGVGGVFLGPTKRGAAGVFLPKFPPGPRRPRWPCGKNGKVATTDGPYAETKEQLGGIQILEARDLNHAIQLVSQLPGFKFGLGPIEIRPVADISEIIEESEQRRRKDTGAGSLVKPADVDELIDEIARLIAEAI